MIATRSAQAAVVVWAAVSAVAAVQPPATGGPLRAAGAALFMLAGPAVAGLVTVRRLRGAQRLGPLRMPLLVELLVWFGATLSALVLTSTALLVTGLWSVAAMVTVVLAETLATALWPAAWTWRNADVEE